ncbi:heparin lyase I family protein [Bradyrhizobium sp. 157]|uniref:heparin lyase I family protein n=1 Tax=Bradyrhizobium sp. 157 TaxID=2782631 RepID=UPI001FF974C4|nr:heparin lyase I family protein [Bradyrhizobium sp. 157]MCK1636934.1 heparin lyase I family protein [Bradyrhizobium sp. 157]
MIAARVIMPFLITSFSANAGIIGNGLANLPILLLPGINKANSQLSKSDAATPLGWETVSGSGWWTPATGRLSGGAHTFSSADATSGSTSQGSAPVGVTVVPNITSFSGANGANIRIDGTSAGVQNANQPWSLTKPDSHTLRFEVRPGDHWSTAGWSDLINNGGAERSEVSFSPNYAPGTQVNVSYQLTVEPGAANTAAWLLLNQMHATTQGPPPFAVEMAGERMQVVLRYKTSGMSSYKEVVAYRDPNPIQRGHAYDMNVQMNFDPNGNGYLNVWRDGVQIVKYQGAIGMAGASYYWKAGIYRAAAPETIVVDYRDLQITTPPMPFPQPHR